MRRALRGLSWILALAALAWFAREFDRQLGSFPPLDLTWTRSLAVAGSVLVYAALTLIDGAAWVMLLRATGESLSLGNGLAVFSIAQFGKYVPGNVAQHLGRVYLAGTCGASTRRVVFTLGVEIATAILVGIGLAVATAVAAPALGGAPFAPAELRWRFLALGGVGVVALLGILRLAIRFRPWPLSKLLGPEPIKAPSVRVLIPYVASHVASFLLMSLATDLIARQVFGAPARPFLLLPGVIAVAWLGGYLVPGAPAGLGVREAILLVGLGRIYGPPFAAAVTVATRLVSALADVLLFGFGLLARSRWARPKSQEEQTAISRGGSR
jgi:hypothetical protein